jgi:uncharacterized protein YqhQ
VVILRQMSNQPAVLGPDGVARPYIGGQALMEGVMMRSPHAFSAVVRRRDGSLVVRERPMADLRRGKAAWPLVRGVAALVEALRLGRQALNFSLEIFEQDLIEEQAEQERAAKAEALVKQAPLSALVLSFAMPLLHMSTSPPELPQAASPPAKGGGRGVFLTVISILLPLAIYVALPQAIAEGASSVFQLGLDVRSPLFQLITATAKVALLIGIFYLLRYSPELYRWLQCHGAEHKAIHTYEAGQALSVENARRFPTLHPRCGTTFVVMVALVSIAVFSCLGPLLPQLGLGRLADNVLFFLMKLPFLPLIVGFTFELQRLFAKYCTSGPLRALLWPGFLVQKVTTIEPTDEQLEVALAALLMTLRVEQGETARQQDASFPSYAALAEPQKAA